MTRFGISGSFAMLAAVLVAVSACQVAEEPRLVDSLRLSKDSAASTADGVSIITLNAETSRRIHVAGTPVTFTTSAGSFLPAGTTVTVPTDAQGKARVQLRAPTDASFARVSASMWNLITFDSVSFLRSMPEALVLTTDRVTLNLSTSPPTNAARITATLVRRLGAISAGQSVEFSAVLQRDTTKRAGTMSPSIAIAAPAAAGAPPTAIATFFGDTLAGATILIRAKVSGQPGIQDVLVLTVK